MMLHGGLVNTTSLQSFIVLYRLVCELCESNQRWRINFWDLEENRHFPFSHAHSNVLVSGVIC